MFRQAYSRRTISPITLSPTTVGYTGNLETALVPEQFARGILHEKLDSNGVMAESTDVEVEHFGLLFESSGDVHKTRHVYICAVLLW